MGEGNELRIVCTGSSGFVCSHLVAELKRQGHNVWGYDIVEGQDILDLDMLSEIFKEAEPERVYHLAGSVHMGPAEEDPYRDVDLNLKGTLNILNLCERHGSRLLFTGTGASYGIGDFPQNEENFPRPVSNYGITKLAAEYYVRKWAWSNGLNTRVTRYSSVYGPRRDAGPVNLMLKNALEKGWIRVDGPGHHTRDIVNVKDAVNGTILAMEKGDAGELYNIGSGVETSIVEVAWIIHELTGAEIRHVPHKYSRFDLPRSVYDLTKIRRLGYEPTIGLRDGIKELLENG